MCFEANFCSVVLCKHARVIFFAPIFSNVLDTRHWRGSSKRQKGQEHQDLVFILIWIIVIFAISIWHFPCFWLHCAMRMRCRKQPCQRNYFRPVHVGGVISIPVHILILYYACAMVGIRSRELFPVANSTWAEWYPLRCTHFPFFFVFILFAHLIYFVCWVFMIIIWNYLKLTMICREMCRRQSRYAFDL